MILCITVSYFDAFLFDIGIGGTALELFRSYLVDRTQFVNINGSTSERCALQFGVPQPSVLGPLLYSLYTSPLSDIASKHELSFHFHATFETSSLIDMEVCKCRLEVGSHAGVFRGARFSSLPTNACSTENNIPFPLFCLRGK